jgi:predicted Zn-dependent protease
MRGRSLRIVPIAIAGLIIAWQYFSSERFVNPETGRKSKVGLSVEQEAALGFQSYRQVLAQSRTINSGPQFEMVRAVASRLAAATGKSGEGFEWQVSVIDEDKVNAFCLPAARSSSTAALFPSRSHPPGSPR